MSSLRQEMTELMVLCGFAKTTQATYLNQITQLAKYFSLSPELISEDDLRKYMLHLHLNKHWSQEIWGSRKYGGQADFTMLNGCTRIFPWLDPNVSNLKVLFIM